ncbi:MAG TPA: phosphate ABC transporter substrate-binding protein PstS [Nitrososphaera sp.]|nr:phosphate ABC transporter substrate-binding protein PstS [Nitrososphaera sp.]
MLTLDRRKLFVWLVAGILLVSFVPSAMSAKAYAQSRITINGAGATFPYPLIDTWRVEYQQVNPDIDINYQSIGSGGGVKQFTEKTVDFGASDAPLTESERNALSGAAMHIPETIGSVVVAYNIPGFEQKGLKLTGPIIADIFSGKIDRWDDPAIKELNPDASLPSQNIVVVHRSDGSGTTFVWTSYLSAVSQEWEGSVGAGKSVQWPTGIGAPGNEGVASAVKSTPGSIGYVELAYSLTTGMNYGFIQNKEGNFIEPTLESTSAAVGTSAARLPAGDESWQNVSILDAAGEESYPIASFSYLLLYKELKTNPQIDSMEKAKALLEFVNWAITDGQQFADDLDYVPLPDEVIRLNQETLASITFNGQPVLTGIPQSFTVSSTLGDKSYTVTSRSQNAKLTSFTINPEQSVQMKFVGSGEVELTLPKEMIDGITTVKAGNQQIQHQQTSSSSSSTTIRFTVPEGTDSVDIQAAMVVPEFEVIALLILAASIVAAIGITRVMARQNKLAPQGAGL